MRLHGKTLKKYTSPSGFEHGSSSLVVECSTSEPFLLYNIIEIILEECILAIRT